jgi:hypothetical protein
MTRVDQNTWEQTWAIKENQATKRQKVLDQVLDVLRTEGQSADACHRRKEAADWLGYKASEISDDDRLLDKALKALISTANHKDEDPEVRRSARSACQKIWEMGWGKETSELPESRRPDMLRQILIALQEEEDDPDDWRFRRTTTVWLRKQAADLTQDDSMADEALQALRQRVIKDTDAFIKREAEEAIEAIWNAAWDAEDDREEKRRAVLKLTLQALGTDNRQGSDAWLVRRMAAKWLRERADEIAYDDRMLNRCLELLIATTKKSGEQVDVRRISREASRAIWEAGWNKKELADVRRHNVLSRILKALAALEEDVPDWQYRQATASWLEDKAADLAADDSMAHKALEALIGRVVNDPDEYVRRSSEKAITAIWNEEWEAAGQEEKQQDRQAILDQVLVVKQQDCQAILDQVLVAIAWYERNDGDACQIGRIAADWLASKASGIVKDDNSTVQTLRALLDLADYFEGNQPEISRSASQASVSIWNAGLEEFLQEADQNGQVAGQKTEEPEDGQDSDPEVENIGLKQGQTRTLRMIQQALRHSADPEMRLAANVWLEKAAPGLARLEYQVYRRVADALATVRRDPTASDELKDHAQIALRALWSQLREEGKKQLDVLEDDGDTATEDKKAKAIYELADRNTLGSREMLHKLVKTWIRWIRSDKDPRLVDLTAETIRYNRYAIPALVEAFASHGNSEKDEESQKRVELRIAKQLADMSDPIFFEDGEDSKDQEKRKAEYESICQDMQKLVVPFCIVKLAEQGQRKPTGRENGNRPASNGQNVDGSGQRPETKGGAENREQLGRMDAEIREHLVRALAYTGGREAVDAISRLVVGRERERQGNRARLDEYYLQPSKRRREQAAKILEGTITESENTLSLLRFLNVLVFAVGLIALIVGLRMFLFGEASWQHWLGLVSAFGGAAGMITLLVWDSLDQIQNNTASLVEVETAFTGFIWQLNLNQTLIQSRYVNNGELGDDEIQQTSDRVERAMELTMNLVSTYTKEREPRVVTRIDRLEPGTGQAGQEISVYGRQLMGDGQTLGAAGRGGMVAINHKPIDAGQEPVDWQLDVVKFPLPESIQPGTVWISLIINGMETNALPFQVE